MVFHSHIKRKFFIEIEVEKKEEKEKGRGKKPSRMKSLVTSLRDRIAGVDKKKLEEYKKW